MGIGNKGRRLPADFNAIDLLERWVRAELEILWAERVQCEGEQAREKALGDVLDRICHLRSHETAEGS